MMKGGYFYERRTKQLSLFFIGVVFTTIIVWSWEKNPFITTLIPSHSQVMQLFPAGEVNVKQVTQSKDDFRESEEVSNLASPLSSINSSPLLSPSSPINTPSLDIQEGEYSRTSQEKHHENTSNTVEKPVSSELTENYSDSKPPKQQFLKPISPKNLDSDMGTQDIGVPIANDEKQGCNFGKGKWVIDNNRPLYSGFGCKQWLSGMWACRLTQRTDFEYEKLKWQPKDCKMDDFSALQFLKRMQDKTLAFIGDSLGRQQFQSLMCMLTAGEERTNVEDVGKEFGLVKARGSIRPDGWAYRFKPSNTTILYYWSASLCDLEPIDPGNRSTHYAMHLDRPPAFLKRYINKFHVLVLNTGHHWNRGKINGNKWIMYVNGTRVTNRKILEIGSAKNLTVYSIVNWVNGELGKYPGLKAFYRSISPRHFFNGDWNTGGTCDKTTPGELEVLQEVSSDLLAVGAVRGTNVRILDITALSEVREEGHISRYSIKATSGMQDCLHWCLPGIPDTWNEILFAQI